MPQPEEPGTHAANLDLLRSVAVLLVLVTHFSHFLGNHLLYWASKCGVLFFFVHTSLVLLQSLDRLHASGTGAVPIRFYMQRVFRIYPLYIAAIVVSFAVGGQVSYTDKSWLGWKWFAANLLLIQNAFGMESISPPMWSLAYEMQMYLLLPAIYLITRRRDALAALALISVVASIVAITMEGLLPPGGNPAVTFFVPCFLSGAYAFVLHRHAKENWNQAGFAVLLVGLVVLFMLGHNWIFAWPLCTILGLAIPHFRELRPGILSAACRLIARYSYGLYLWHWPLLWLCFYRLVGVSLAVRCGLFFCSLVPLCFASYHWLEAPLIRIGRRSSQWRDSHQPIRETPTPALPCQALRS